MYTIPWHSRQDQSMRDVRDRKIEKERERKLNRYHL